MPELRSVRSICDGHKTRTTAVLQLRPDLQIEASAHNDLSAVSLGVLGKRWSARLEHPSQDAVFELKRDSLTIVQAVPAGKLYLFPNPALKFDKRAVLRSDGASKAVLSSRTQLGHDCLTRHSAAAQTLYAGPGRERKLKAGFDSRQGPELAARLKLRGSALHSVAASVSVPAGPALQLKSRPSAGQKLSLTVQPQRQAVIGAVQLEPEGGSTKLSATAVCGFGDKAPASKLLLDVLWQV